MSTSSPIASRRAPAADGLGAANVPDRVPEQIAPVMAEAFGATFWWALGLLVLAFAAAFLLPFEKTEALDEPAEEDAAPVAIPV